MGVLSPRLKAFLAAGSDQVDVAVDLVAPLTIIDTEIGIPNIGLGSPLPTVPYDGQVRFDKNDGMLKSYDSATTLWKVISPGAGAALASAGLGAWKQITPTLTNVTIGTATQISQLNYVRLPGNLIYWELLLLLGTGGTYTGNISFALPVEYPIDISAGVAVSRASDPLGWGETMQAAASARNTFTPVVLSTVAPGTVFFLINNTSGSTAIINATQPFVPAVNTELKCRGLYRTSAA